MIDWYDNYTVHIHIIAPQTMHLKVCILFYGKYTSVFPKDKGIPQEQSTLKISLKELTLFETECGEVKLQEALKNIGNFGGQQIRISWQLILVKYNKLNHRPASSPKQQLKSPPGVRKNQRLPSKNYSYVFQGTAQNNPAIGNQWTQTAGHEANEAERQQK